MSLGGIRDHLGGGFHRYSVDRYWQIPHFEKMLYDNGQLASIYAQAWELTGREDFRRVAVELCDFVLRELTDKDGGFYAALDADFVLAKLRTKDGRLLRTYSAGEAKLNAYLNDYAFLADGLLRLHHATGNPHWLDEAAALTAKQIELFSDERGGGFFFTSNDHEALLARGKEVVDGAVPAGNSVAAHNLILLSAARSQPEYLALARKTIAATV